RLSLLHGEGPGHRGGIRLRLPVRSRTVVARHGGASHDTSDGGGMARRRVRVRGAGGRSGAEGGGDKRAAAGRADGWNNIRQGHPLDKPDRNYCPAALQETGLGAAAGEFSVPRRKSSIPADGTRPQAEGGSFPWIAGGSGWRDTSESAMYSPVDT